MPADRRGVLDAAGARAVDVLGGYMVGTAAISAFGAASQWVIMVLLGLPFALPLAVLALFAGFIPYIGGFIATFLAFLVAVAVGDSTTIVIMGIYTLVFNIVQGNFVTPLVYGKAVSLHPAIVLLAVPIGNALAGIVGMFLVVPVAGVIATTWRAVLQTISGDVVEPAPLMHRPGRRGRSGSARGGGRRLTMDVDRPEPRRLARVISPREMRLLFWLIVIALVGVIGVLGSGIVAHCQARP